MPIVDNSAGPNGPEKTTGPNGPEDGAGPQGPAETPGPQGPESPGPHGSEATAPGATGGPGAAGSLTLTVVIPCYNRADSVAAAVQSVLDQDWPAAQAGKPGFEVIAVDDGSTDATLAVLRGIADPRLRVIENPGPKGACGARNAGARAGSGAWIAFQDSDDLWRPAKLRRQMAALAAAGPDCVAVYCGMEIRGADGGIAGRVPDPAARGPRAGAILPALVWTSLVSTQTLIVRRDAFEAAQGFDPAMPALQDWDLMLRVAAEGPVAFVEEALVEQRLSGNSITRSSAKRVDAQERLLRNHAGLWARHPAAAAYHHYRIAGGHRRLGAYRPARAAAEAAARLAPGQWRYRAMAAWLKLASAFTPG